MLDRNLCLTEDSCLFFDSADAIARIIVRARQKPFMPQPSANAFNHKFVDAVRLHANLPDLKLPKGNSAMYDTADLAFGGRDGDPVARMVNDLRSYADQTVSETHLLETIRKTSTAARTGRSTDANGADANRFRAAFDSAKTILQTTIGKQNSFYLSMFQTDDPLGGSAGRRAKRAAVSAEALVEASLPYLDMSGNARYVPPFYQSIMTTKHGKELLKVRPWGRQSWSAAVRQRWYESDKSDESDDAAAHLLTQMVEKHERAGRVRGDVGEGELSLIDLALLGGLNPRTFFDVALWQFPNRFHGIAIEDSNKNSMIRRFMHSLMSFMTDEVIDVGVIEQDHNPAMAIKAMQKIWKTLGNSRKREKRLFRNFWLISNDICRRISPKDLNILGPPDLLLNRAEQVHHFLFNNFTALGSNHGFAPDITLPPPMHARTVPFESGPTFGARGHAVDDDEDDEEEDDSDDDYDGSEECEDKKFIAAQTKYTTSFQHHNAILKAVRGAEKHKKEILQAGGNASTQTKEIAARQKQLEVAAGKLGKAKRDMHLALKMCHTKLLEEDDADDDSRNEDPVTLEEAEAINREDEILNGFSHQEKTSVMNAYGVSDLSPKRNAGGHGEQSAAKAKDANAEQNKHGIDRLWIHILRCVYRGGRAYVAIAHRVTEQERAEARGDDDPETRRFRELFARLVANVLVMSREAHPTSNRVFWERQMAETQFQRVEIMQQITALCGAPTPVQIDTPWMTSHPVSWSNLAGSYNY